MVERGLSDTAYAVGYASLGSPDSDPDGAEARAPRWPAVPVAAQPGSARVDALAERITQEAAKEIIKKIIGWNYIFNF